MLAFMLAAIAAAYLAAALSATGLPAWLVRVRRWRALGACALLLLVLAPAAHADTVVATTTPVAVDYIDAALKAVFGTALTAIAAWIAVHVRDALLRQAINMALSRAAGIAIDYAGRLAGSFDPAMVHNAALSAGIVYMRDQLPAKLAHFGIQPADLERMITGEIQKLGGLPAPNAVVPPQPAAPGPATPPASANAPPPLPPPSAGPAAPAHA